MLDLTEFANTKEIQCGGSLIKPCTTLEVAGLHVHVGLHLLNLGGIPHR